MINKADVKEIKKLYNEKFGLELDNDTARLKLTLLVKQVELTYKPVTVVEDFYAKVVSRKS